MRQETCQCKKNMDKEKKHRMQQLIPASQQALIKQNCIMSTQKQQQKQY